MADKQLQIIIELQAAQAESELKKLAGSLDGVGQAGRRTGTETQRVSESLRSASQQATQATRNVKALDRGTRELSVGFRGFIDRLKHGIRALHDYNAKLRQTKHDAGQANVAVRLLRRGLMMLGGVMVFRHAFRTMAEFSEGMATVRALTNATQDEFEALERRAKDLGATTRFSATQAAEGLQALARAGLNSQEAVALVGDTLILAQAGALDLGRSAELTAIAMKVFGFRSNETHKIVDTFATAANSAMTDVNQLGESLKHAGPVAAAANVSFNETVAALTALADAGLQGSMAGTGLRAVLVALSKPSKEAQRILSGLGIELENIDVSSRGLSAVLEEFRGKAIGVGEAAVIAGTRGGAALLSLIKSMDMIKERTEVFGNAGGEAKRLAEVMDTSLKGAVLSVKSAWEGLLLSFDESAKHGQGLILILEQVAGLLRDLSGETQGASVALSNFFGIIAYGVAGLRDSFRGLELIWQGAQIAWSFLAELLTTGFRYIQIGVQALVVGFLRITKVFKQIEVVWEKVLDAMRRGLSAFLQKVRNTLEAIGEKTWGVMTVPDSVLRSLHNVEIELIRAQKGYKGVAEEAVKASQREIDAANQKLVSLMDNRSENEEYWADQTVQAEKRIRELAAEESAIGSLSRRLKEGSEERLRRAEEEAKQLPEILRRMREAREKEAARAAEDDTPPVISPEAELAVIQQKQKTIQLLGQIEIAAAQNTHDRLAAMDKLAIEESKLRVEERLAQARNLFENELIDRAKFLATEKEIVQAHENELADIRTNANQRLLETRRETHDFLAQIEIAGAKNVREQLYAMDKLAIEEAALRAQERLMRLRTLLENELITKEEFLEKEKELVQAHENELADIRTAAQLRVLETTKEALGGLESAMSTFYELSGKQSKEAFYAQKAISVAMTMIKTYEAAQKAFDTGAEVHPALGAVMAAVAVAEGLARVAMIKSQGLALGGVVAGHSPTSTADNIPAQLTAGEFVQPVKTVQYYGGGIMEALRQRSIPRGVLAAYSAPTRPPSNRFAYQAGGSVTGSGRETAMTTAAAQPQVTIANYVGDDQIERFLASKPGQRVILNALSQNSFQARRAIQE